MRLDGFYVIDLESDEVAIENALNNPGTLSVTNMLTNKIVWDFLHLN